MFEPLIINWKGAEYRVEPDNVLRLIATVEDELTLAEISAFSVTRKTVPMAKLALAYGKILRYAGAPADDQEVYKSLMQGGAEAIQSVTVTLLAMMAPPDSLSKPEGDVSPGK